MTIIFNIQEELSKYGLTGESFEELLKDCSDKTQKITDCDWSDLVDKYNLGVHYDTLRKSQVVPFGGAFVRDYFMEKMLSINVDDEYFNKLRIEKQEIIKEKRKLYDERLDLNRRLRETARMETTVEKIENMLSEIGDKRYIKYSPIESKSDTDMIVCLSDLHIGAAYYGFDGCYNSEIAKERMNKYLSEIIDIQNTHKSEKCIVVGLGDFISGAIHTVISVTNKENVVEQVELACEYISDFVYELGKYFNEVEFRNVGGNHSRIGTKKEDCLLDERLDAMIPWFMKSMLKNCTNITVYQEEDELDSTLSSFFVRDRLYFAIHGDQDSMTESSIAKLALWAKMTPYCVLTGHKHFPAMTDVSGIKVIQSGSLCGSGDEFTRSKRLTGKPSQTVLIVNDDGIKAIYPVEL